MPSGGLGETGNYRHVPDWFQAICGVFEPSSARYKGNPMPHPIGNLSPEIILVALKPAKASRVQYFPGSLTQADEL